jgi:hypothetical protein
MVDPVRPRVMQPVFVEDIVAMSSLLEVRSLSPRSPAISLLREMGRTSEIRI